ncbi:MAG TPA: ABC transporter ATP-binding protein [Gaiellaceae bacterium]|jgi:oligopeptide/dipeptide ABC transporter ATP-binding protein
MTEPILEVRGLRTAFSSHDGPVPVLDGVDFQVADGEILGLVGESGSGKTITALSVLQLLPAAAQVTGGEILFRGENLLELDRKQMNRVRGADISMIFQNPRGSLNPLYRVEKTLEQVLWTHRRLRGGAARTVAIELLADVGLPDPRSVLRRYPHELSGGMCQRVMIAYALASNPRLLIADEPTTALDVTVQLQIIELLGRLRREHGLTLVLITHNLSVVAELCDRVGVMYLGRIVEQGPVLDIFDAPRHPYTVGLLGSRPTVHVEGDELRAIPGQVPDLRNRPSGCVFHPRCPLVRPVCSERAPARETVAEGHDVECHFWRKVAGLVETGRVA